MRKKRGDQRGFTLVEMLCATIILVLLGLLLNTGLQLSLKSYRELRAERLFGAGGMPSSHSACVCACAAAVGYLYGMRSALFAIAAVVAVVVMYDAFNVRQETGKQARILNYMMEHWSQMRPGEILDRALRELVGHTPLQVLMGALLVTLLALRREERGKWQGPFRTWWGIVAGSGILFFIPGMVSTALEVFFTISAALLTRHIYLRYPGRV